MADQGGPEQLEMRFLDGNALGRRAAAQFSYDGGFDVTDQELRHGKRLLSMIAAVKAEGGQEPEDGGPCFVPLSGTKQGRQGTRSQRRAERGR